MNECKTENFWPCTCFLPFLPLPQPSTWTCIPLPVFRTPHASPAPDQVVLTRAARRIPMARRQCARRVSQEHLYFPQTARIRNLHPALSATSSHIASSTFSYSVSIPVIRYFLRTPMVHPLLSNPQDGVPPLRASGLLSTIPLVLHSFPVVKGSLYQHRHVSFTYKAMTRTR
jgi:hypothetical protein